MHLTLDDMRIDGAADIVRRDDFEQPDLAGFLVHLDNGGLRGIRIRREIAVFCTALLCTLKITDGEARVGCIIVFRAAFLARPPRMAV